jgi:hypothetical protein
MRRRDLLRGALAAGVIRSTFAQDFDPTTYPKSPSRQCAADPLVWRVPLDPPAADEGVNLTVQA